MVLVLIKARIDKPVTTTIDVVFPLFLKYGDVFDSGGHYDTYLRYDENMMRYSITEHDDHWELETKLISKEQLSMDLGYHMIEQGREPLAPDEFYRAMDGLLSEIKGIPPRLP